MGFFSSFFKNKGQSKGAVVEETISEEPVKDSTTDNNLYKEKVDNILKNLENLGYGPLMLEKIRQDAMEIINKGVNGRSIEFNLNSLILQLYTNNINKLREQTENKIARDPDNSNYYKSLLQVECGFAIDIDAEIDKKIKELSVAGYGNLALEKFKKEMLDIVKNKLSDQLTFKINKDIFYSLENYCNGKIRDINNYKENYLSQFLEHAKDDVEKKWYKKQFEIKFGHSFDYKDEIKNKIDELKEAGYGDILLKRIGNEMFKQIDEIMNQAKTSDDINQKIFYTIEDFFHNCLLRINDSKKELQRKIVVDEVNKDFYQRQFEIQFGHPFDSNVEIENKIKELKEAGYGDTLLKKYKQEVLELTNSRKGGFLGKKSNLTKFNQINDFFNVKLKDITKDIEILKQNINRIMDIEENEKDKLFERLYGNNVLSERKRLLIDLYKNEFQIKFGNDILNDYIKNSMEYLKTFGFSEQTINEEFQKCLNSQDDNQSSKDLVRQIQSVISIMQRENASLLLLLISNKESMDEFANIFFGNISNDNGLLIIKDILSVYDESRKQLYASIDERVYSYKKDNMEKSNSADIARSLYPDNDFIIKSAELNDKETDSLNLGSDKPFTEWLNMVKTIKQLENIEIEKKSSHK